MPRGAERQMRGKLMEAARRREIDVAPVWRLDRWGRSVADLLATLLPRSPTRPLLAWWGGGTGASRHRLRLAHRSSRSDHGRRPRHGGAAGCVRRVRARGPARTGPRRPSPNPPERKTAGPSPPTPALQADQVRKLHRSGLSKSKIARQLRIGRASARRILAASPRKK